MGGPACWRLVWILYRLRLAAGRGPSSWPRRGHGCRLSSSYSGCRRRPNTVRAKGGFALASGSVPPGKLLHAAVDHTRSVQRSAGAPPCLTALIHKPAAQPLAGPGRPAADGGRRGRNHVRRRCPRKDSGRSALAQIYTSLIYSGPGAGAADQPGLLAECGRE